MAEHPIKISARKYKEGYSEEKRPSTCDMTGICITSTNFEFKHAIRSKFNVPGDVNIELYRELAGSELTGNTVEEMGIAPGEELFALFNTKIVHNSTTRRGRKIREQVGVASLPPEERSILPDKALEKKGPTPKVAQKKRISGAGSQQGKKKRRRKDWQRVQHKKKRAQPILPPEECDEEGDLMVERAKRASRQEVDSELEMAKCASMAIYEATEARRTGWEKEMLRDAPNMQARNIASIGDRELRQKIINIQMRSGDFKAKKYYEAWEQRKKHLGHESDANNSYDHENDDPDYTYPYSCVSDCEEEDERKPEGSRT